MKVLWGDIALYPQSHLYVRVLYIELDFGRPDAGKHIGWELELEVVNSYSERIADSD